MRKLRLLVLASKPKGLSPSQRFRLEQWAPHLSAAHDIELDFAPFESSELTALLYKKGHIFPKAWRTLLDYARRAAILSRARRYDAVVIHREAALIGPAIYERVLAAEHRPIIYDFDDAIWSPGQAWGHGFFSLLHFPAKTSSICRLARVVTTGNQFLADYARKRNPNVRVVPTSIELADYPLVPEATGERFVVCWTGSTSTLVHFEHAREPLERLARLLPLTVKVVCNKPPERPIADAEMQFVPWSSEREAQELGDCHVGIMPLPDDEVSRGKCGLKALQCMATGRPVVISPVGVNVDIVEHGKNGYLAATADDFVSCLHDLSKSPERRREMGARARKTVEDRYSSEVSAAAFAGAVRSVAA